MGKKPFLVGDSLRSIFQNLDQEGIKVDIDLDEIGIGMPSARKEAHKDAKDEEWGHIVPIAHDEVGPHEQHSL